MIKQLLLTLSIFCTFSGLAQFGDQQVISTTTIKPYLSIPFDIDNDGFIDVLTASEETYKMSWYKNLDGLGNFGPEIIINETPVYYLSVEFVDLDSDGDKDILYLKNNPRQLAWLENLDGLGTFSVEQIIKGQNFISSVIYKDFDDDGDNDLIAIVNTSSRGWIVWYENLDGEGTFGDENRIIQNNTSFTKILTEDIDGDGLLDILATESVLAAGSIFWYKNLGDNNFGEALQIYQFEYFQSGGTTIVDFSYSDINTDGKKDLVIAASEETGVVTYWLENMDNLGGFGPIQYIGDLGYSYLFYDLDNDGDLDILIRGAQSILWKENEDGLGNYGLSKLISSNNPFLRDSKAADLDGDGQLDIMSAALSDNKLAWYKNNTLNISDNKTTSFIVFPNPTDGLVNLKSEKVISKISVFDTLGQIIATNLENNQIDLTKAASGVYLLKIEDENGNSQTHKIVKE